MKAPKWFIVARNEYRIRTSSIREIRPLIPYVIVGGLALYVLYIAPKIVSLIINDLIVFFLSQAAVAAIDVILFVFFFMFITFPISYTLRDVQTAQQEIFLSAPIKPSHVLLGEFLGELPLYAIMVVCITGFFTAVLKSMGLNAVQMFITILVFIIIFTSALWIGTVLSALLRTKLGSTSRGRDIGKAFALLIILPALALMYAIMGGRFMEFFSDPGTTGLVKTVFGIFPSSWGAEVIIDFASHPGDMSAVWFVTVTRLGGLIVFLVVLLVLGIKAADRAYSLETTTFTGARVKTDGALYKAIKRRGPFSTLLVTVFKVYTRRLQNISWIVYIVGLMTLLNIFVIRPEDSMDAVVMGFFLLPLLAAVVSFDITLRGKDTLFIYRKTPSGEGRFIKAMVVKGWVVAVPVAVAIIAVSMLLSPQVTSIELIKNVGIVAAMVAADVAFASGVFLIMPVYTDKGPEFALDIMIIVMASFGLFIVAVEVFDNIMVLPLLHWLVGLLFLYFGKLNLGRIE